MFQLFHSTLLESDRAARGRSLFAKKKKKGETREMFAKFAPSHLELIDA
jgi:hypothetical protein